MTANAHLQLNAALSGRYTIEGTLGTGGMATVYLAHDIRHDRKVAVKLLNADLGAMLGAERFLSEIRVTANLQHPNLLPLFDSGSADGLLYYVMPYVEGETLRKRLDRERQLPVDEAIRITTAVANALDYAHQHGVIHRDLKPENILLQHDQPVVADFGIALSLTATSNTRLTEIGISLGTPAYMSPEQATGETALDARSDIYALACVTYEMLCGHPPFTGANSRAIISKSLTEKPQRITAQRERVPAHVDTAVLTALEKDPADRFASMREFATALQDGSIIGRERGRRLAPLQSRWLVAALGIVALVATGVWVATRSSRGANDAASAAPTLSILIGGVVNRTGDTTLDAVLPELLATTLEQSRALSVYPRANLGFVLQRMQRDARTPIDEAVGREICAREGLAAVDGARNAPHGDTAQFDGEVTGDVETVAALAPRARIAVYFAPNSPRGFLEAVAMAVHDRRQRNTVLSISWGLAEVHWDRGTLHAFNQVLLEAAVLGITVCCSAGDYGPWADTHDRKPHVNFPASSPYVLACGGTTLLGSGRRIRSERVWHNEQGASGGGVSEIFPRPTWQLGHRVPRAANGLAGRGVPDVASNADPLTGYRVFGRGQWHVGAGTSASAPLWAGLVALINQRVGTAIGLPTPFLYSRFAELVRTGAVVPIIHGGNGLFRARRGWSCCTGVGSPRGARLAEAFARLSKPK